jgi:hypothetical protein
MHSAGAGFGHGRNAQEAFAAKILTPHRKNRRKGNGAGMWWRMTTWMCHQELQNLTTLDLQMTKSLFVLMLHQKNRLEAADLRLANAERNVVPDHNVNVWPKALKVNGGSRGDKEFVTGREHCIDLLRKATIYANAMDIKSKQQTKS